MGSLLDNDPEMQRLLGNTSPIEMNARAPRSVAGGAYDGAGRFDRELALWNPGLRSADADILPEKDTADARVRDSIRNDAYISGATTTIKDTVVGAMYVLNSKPNWRVLGLDEVWAEEFQEEVESKFTLAAESVDCWFDAARKKTFTEIIRLGTGIHVSAGEILATAEWHRESDRPFRTCVQVVDLDRLSNPPGRFESRYLRGGVELNENGRPLGYHIRMSHPSDLEGIDLDAYRWKYVPARKPWGRMQVIHILEETRAQQTRGVSELVSALSEMKMTKGFRRIMLQNAVVNATYAASIESELPTEVIYQMLGTNNLSAAQVQELINNYATAYLSSVGKYVGSRGMALDGVKIPHLYPGTKLNLRPAGGGGPLGSDFEHSLLRYVAAALGLSAEQFSKDFSKTNYSSAKAAMAETEKAMQARKKLVADRLASHIYRLWLEESIASGSIESLPRRAPEFWEGLNRDAYSACEWVGASRGQIDELKETQAAALRIKYNLSTYEEEMARLGRDWRKMFAQRERENAIMRERGLTGPYEDNMMNAASGAPREVEE